MSGPTLASEVLKRWFNRRRPDQPRAVRIVLEANGRTIIDISSKLALSMIDVRYGKPVIQDLLVESSDTPCPVRLTISEVES